MPVFPGFLNVGDKFRIGQFRGFGLIVRPVEELEQHQHQHDNDAPKNYIPPNIIQNFSPNPMAGKAPFIDLTTLT